MSNYVKKLRYPCVNHFFCHLVFNIPDPVYNFPGPMYWYILGARVPLQNTHVHENKEKGRVTPKRNPPQADTWKDIFALRQVKPNVFNLMSNLLHDRTDFSCHHDICPGNISPGDICPYQQYLRSYWPNFDQTFGTQFFGGLNFRGPKSFLSHYPPTHHYLPD